MLIMVKFSHWSVLFISSTELFSDLIISPCKDANKCSHVFPCSFTLLLTSSSPPHGPSRSVAFLLFLFPIARMQGRAAGMGGLEASDPLQFIPPPTLPLRMGDFLLVYVKSYNTNPPRLLYPLSQSLLRSSHLYQLYVTVLTIRISSLSSYPLIRNQCHT